MADGFDSWSWPQSQYHECPMVFQWDPFELLEAGSLLDEVGRRGDSGVVVVAVVVDDDDVDVVGVGDSSRDPYPLYHWRYRQKRLNSSSSPWL
jgi:hypothetical protein